MDSDLDINKDFVFTTDKNGCLRGGGFKIESNLLNETMNNKDIQTGGNINIMNTFKNLVVPDGLFYTQKKVQKILEKFALYAYPSSPDEAWPCFHLIFLEKNHFHHIQES